MSIQRRDFLKRAVTGDYSFEELLVFYEEILVESPNRAASINNICRIWDECIDKGQGTTPSLRRTLEQLVELM